MSERVPGIPLAAIPARAQDAGHVLLYRGPSEAREILWVRKAAEHGWAAGLYALPGGRVEAGDAQTPMTGTPEAGPKAAAALRGLFEQTGILWTSTPVSADIAKNGSDALHDHRARFADFLKHHGLFADAAALNASSRWVTSTAFPNRMDSTLYCARVETDVQPVRAGGRDIVEAAWIRASDALQRWSSGAAVCHPQLLHALEVAASPIPDTALTEKLRQTVFSPGGVSLQLEFQKGVRAFPMKTPTLPPATHTNTYVLGNGELLIVDPGSPHVRERAQLFAYLESLKTEGKKVKAVFLTHHHEDHVSGAEAVRERLRVPIWGHVLTAERLKFSLDRVFDDRDTVELQGSPAMRWRVIHTPGHARGHLILRDEASGAGVVGDLVAGVGTILIDPPEGDMLEYMNQLRRVAALAMGTLYPAHGPPLPEGSAKLTELLRHREMRERQVLDALKGTPPTLPEIARRAYPELPPEMFPLAERSTHAIVLKLVREGRIARKDDRYART
ncbi:MAG: MBL fold metallo-hydrolase [Myxococcaceae bacterium]